MRRHFFLAAWLGACVLAPSLSAADVAAGQKKTATPAELEAAKRLFSKGHLAYRDKHYEQAIIHWQDSYALSHKTLIFEGISRAYEKLKNYKAAVKALKRWRADAPKNEHHDLDARLSELRHKAEAVRTANPKPDRVDPDPDRGDGADPGGGDGGDDGKGTAVVDPKVGTDDAANSTAVAGGALLGVGIAAVLTGIILDLAAVNTRPPPEDFCRDEGDLLICKQVARDNLEIANTLALVGDVTWITGAAIAATGAVLLGVALSEDSDTPKEDSGLVVVPWIVASPGATAAERRVLLGIRGRF